MPQSSKFVQLWKLCKTVARSPEMPQSSKFVQLWKLCKTVARSPEMPPPPMNSFREICPPSNTVFLVWQHREFFSYGDQ